MIFGKMRRPAERKGLLTRLARDARGNTLAIVAAAMIPLAAMIGSGIDMSRAYMAKTRLQSACDAAALAGRRVMQNDAVDTNVVNTATQFLNFNFPQSLYQTTAFSPNITKPESGTVHIDVRTRMPTAVMRMFGFSSLPLNVSCDASLNFVNTDIMLVLDVTGSMAQDVNGRSTSVAANQKISALRDAVLALYDELKPIQDQLEANNLRLRYGVVPYSSTVNVGSLIRAVDPSYLASSVSYQTRVANYTNPNYSQTDSPEQTLADESSNQSRSSRCTSWANDTVTTGTPPATTTTDTYTYASYNSSNGTCVRHHTRHTTTYTLQNYGFQNYTQQASTYDTSQYKLGNAVRIGTNTNGHVPTSQSFNLQQLASISGVSTANSSWNGCIEERSTVSTITSSSGFNIPTGAYDLNVNFIPNSDATRWRPMWPDVEYRTTTSQPSWACPAQAQRLQAMTRAQLVTYVNSLQPTGNTYHDIGMIWGARLISNGGIFADSTDTYNGMPVTRHIIFMTDGIMEPSTSVYSAYGVESLDKRITGGSTSEQTARHTQRFRMICNAAKTLNASIWVIGFGVSLSNELTECASNASQASTVADRDALIARFRQIGSQIGALRLTQ